MGAFIGMLAGKQLFGRTITEPVARAIGIAGLVLLILGVAGGIVLAIRNDAVSDHEAHQVQRAAKATEKASTERAQDAVTNSKNDQERHDVINAQPDQPIAPTSLALSCKRLRDAGKHPSACRGSEGRH